MMKTDFSQTALPNGRRRILTGSVFAVAVAFLSPDATALPTPVDLGTASGFAVLAGSGISVAGAANSTTITGDIGTFPTLTISGLGNVVLNGVNQAGDAVTQQAKADLVTAYNDAAGRPATTSYGPIYDLGAQTLAPGVYHDPSSFGITGTLTLDAHGDPNAVWIFQAGSTLITASDSVVSLIDGAQACHVFWQVGSSATLGTGTDFVGNILALSDITLDAGATVDGRLLAQNGAVSLDSNTVTKSVCNTSGTPTPDAGSTLALFACGLVALLAFRRQDLARA